MALAPLRLPPDLMSLVALLLGLLAAGLLAAGEGVVSGLTAHAASVADGVDGEVARLGREVSTWMGKWPRDGR
jgi:phosphatidylserine synthase